MSLRPIADIINDLSKPIPPRLLKTTMLRERSICPIFEKDASNAISAFATATSVPSGSIVSIENNSSNVGRFEYGRTTRHPVGIFKISMSD